MRQRRMGALGTALMAAGGAAAVWAAVGLAGGEALSGRITADGSSTVAPYTTAAAESFMRRNRGVQVTVGVSGTGGGFERFCKGETDISNASRPMRQSEAARCRDGNVRYSAFLVANDGISLVMSRRNTWVNCLTVDELKRIWSPGSRIDNWRDVRASFPNVPLRLYGPGTDSGTFEFFTERINGRARSSRSDYTASEDDNVLVQGVSGQRGSLGYFGYSYYIENRNRLKLLAVNNGSGCVTPSPARIRAYSYKPLSRPLFVYVKRSSFERAAVQAFVRFAIANEKSIARTARMVSLTARQIRKARLQYDAAIRTARRR